MYFIYHLKAHTLAESISSGVRSHRFSERSPLSFCLSPWSLTRSPSQSVTGVRQVQWAHTYLGHFASLKAHMLAESISSGVRSHRFSERTPLLFGLSPWASHGRRVNQLQEWHRYSERTPYLGYFARSIVALRAHTLAESISRGGVRSHRFSERTPLLFGLFTLKPHMVDESISYRSDTGTVSAHLISATLGEVLSPWGLTRLPSRLVAVSTKGLAIASASHISRGRQDRLLDQYIYIYFVHHPEASYLSENRLQSVSHTGTASTHHYSEYYRNTHNDGWQFLL
jgi:hypothetical protein